MIIGGQAEFLPVHELIAKLQRAARGVMRIAQLSQKQQNRAVSVSTGWLITDSLVVVPRYTMRPFDELPIRLACTQFDPSKGAYVSIDAKLISDDLSPQQFEHLMAEVDKPGPTRLELQKPALLRLQEPWPEGALSLELSNPRKSERLFVLQHPEGNPQVQLGIGRLIDLAQPLFTHDADTIGGSSGSPIFNSNWNVVGMQVGAAPGKGLQAQVNEGLSLSFLLELLQSSPEWEEIARHHKLADLRRMPTPLESIVASSAPRPAEAILTAAAVRWDFSPKSLSEKDAHRLRPLVIDPQAERWSLRATERERAVRAAGSLQALRLAQKSSDLSGDSAGPRQEVIDAILHGPPFDLDQIADEDLPYWLQAVRWFANVVPALPSAGNISRELERRRIRGRLHTLAGANFRGRTTELKTLHGWYADQQAGPIVISGIGGIGKSALIAQFALQLPDDTILFWLDFDRADLTPDDAVSVVNALVRQATMQLEGFNVPSIDESPTNDEVWKKAAEQFGHELAKIKDRHSLLVLDSFEVAQHVKKHQEIWALLELIFAQAPELRVVVSGRAPVYNLTLYGRKAQGLPIVGMDRADAVQWLKDYGVNSGTEFSKWFVEASSSASSAQKSLAVEAVEQILNICAGVPLRLKLALRWLEKGGKVDEIPTKLPHALVEGFLYQRILDRVIDPALMPIARAALVLRRVTVEMVADVLGPALPDDVDPLETFSRLAQEMAVVEADGAQTTSFDSPAPSAEHVILRVRPELRAATLRLLELDDVDRVRAVDERAAAWYRQQNISDETNAAELVYHLLRLGDIPGAEQALAANEDCLSHLLYAAEEMPEKEHGARDWLRTRIEGAEKSAAGLRALEQSALEEIKTALARQLYRAVPGILAERPQRSDASPLLFYDAWTLRRVGELTRARQLLSNASDVGGTIGRDRTVLAAQLAVEAGDLAECDRLLASVDRTEHWQDRPEGALEALAVRAARVRLTVDLKTELELWNILKQVGQDPELLPALNLAPSDLLLPSLSKLFAGSTPESGWRHIDIPFDSSDLPAFANALDEARSRYSRGVAYFLPPLSSGGGSSSADIPLTHELSLDPGTAVLEGSWASAAKLARKLAVLGWHRWRFATTSLFLAKTFEQYVLPKIAESSLCRAVVATLVAYSTQNENSFNLFVGPDRVKDPIKELEFLDFTRPPTLTPEQLDLVFAILKVESRSSTSIRDLVARVGPSGDSAVELLKWLRETYEHGETHTLFLYLLSPDPLKLLVERLAGVPTDYVA